MTNKPVEGSFRLPSPRRGEIWTAMTGVPPVRHWVLVVSLDARNLSEHADTILMVPFSGRGFEGPSTLSFAPGETGLPGTSYLKAYYINTLHKSRLRGRMPRPLSNRRMREVCRAIRRAFDTEAPPELPARL